MANKTWKEEAPAHWAGYLFNGTTDDLTDAEVGEIDQWQEAMGGHVVDMEEETYFKWWHGIGQTCATYTLMKIAE